MTPAAIPGAPVPLPSHSIYDVRRHAAKHTEDYVFSQLIPYLGNKRKLLPLIAEAVHLTGEANSTFADLFAGSGVISRWAKQSGFRTVTNDWEPYCAPLGDCFIGLDTPPPGADNLIKRLNAASSDPNGYISTHFCPASDETPDPHRERCFFTRANGSRLDAMRDTIALWEAEDAISRSERAYLVAPLLYAASYVSNTSGVFKAYHHGWGGTTATALYRILSDVHLVAPILWDNGHRNLAFNVDAMELATNWESLVGEHAGVAYLDPPYNQHPYGSNYHLLNTIALWDKPVVPPIARGTKSAIRTDWRTERRSAFNNAKDALPALAALVDAMAARWIIISYSTDGNIPYEALLTMLSERGPTGIVTRRYKRYRVSTTRMSLRPHTVEFVAILDKRTNMSVDVPFCGSTVDEQLTQIATAAGDQVKI